MRSVLKKIGFVASCIAILPIMIVYKFAALIIPEKNIFRNFSQLFSLFPEIPGDYFRKAFYHMTLKHCDRNSTISFGTFFPNQNVEIGKHVYIGANCIIADSVIADDTMIGSNVHIISGKTTHNFADINTPMRLQHGESIVIHVGQDSWIGNGAIVMADIGNKCIIGAGSVVTKKIDDFSIAVGNPARVINIRCASNANIIKQNITVARSNFPNDGEY